MKKGIYQHFKGQRYEVLDVAKHSETMEEFVVYKTLYGDFDTWIRPKSMFEEVVEKEGQLIPRFTYVGE